MHTFIKNSLFFFIIISLTISVISCSDDEDPVAPQEEHFEAIGTVVYYATGAEVLRVLRGTTTDTLLAKVGVLSDHFDVKFIDEDEDVVDAPDDEESSMGIDVSDTNLLEIEQDEPGAFEFHLMGKAIGVTSIEIKILHAGHADYRSGLIPVKIVN
ncbi:MAG: hypothetical protein U5K00_06670 [Melioribacteraceae bacterium]|nr:hypothetical protein [Melioribacteraceae bacterium]